MRGARRKLSTLPECAKKRETALKSPLVDEKKRREKERKKIKQRIEQRSSNKRASIEETRPRIIKKTVMLLDTCRSVTKKRDDKSKNERKGGKKSTGNGTTVEETTAAKIGRERKRRKRKEKWELKIEGKKALSRARDKGRGVRGWG